MKAKSNDKMKPDITMITTLKTDEKNEEKIRIAKI